jgi:pyridoxine/pyridoxamine 5'-phosphate oxidase
METPRDPTAVLRARAHGLRSDLDPDPIKQFSNWFTAAIEAGIRVSMMSPPPPVQTRNRQCGSYIERLRSRRFYFCMNYESEKEHNSKPTLCVMSFIDRPDRQIRISGNGKISREESELTIRA